MRLGGETFVRAPGQRHYAAKNVGQLFTPFKEVPDDEASMYDVHLVLREDVEEDVELMVEEFEPTLTQWSAAADGFTVDQVERTLEAMRQLCLSGMPAEAKERNGETPVCRIASSVRSTLSLIHI